MFFKRAVLTVLALAGLTAATACTAVGYAQGFPFRTIAEAWNGTTWTIQPTPALSR